jgi:cyclophilin family peptidyl-prolyl cis-trans isomerase
LDGRHVVFGQVNIISKSIVILYAPLRLIGPKWRLKTTNLRRMLRSLVEPLCGDVQVLEGMDVVKAIEAVGTGYVLSRCKKGVRLLRKVACYLETIDRVRDMDLIQRSSYSSSTLFLCGSDGKPTKTVVISDSGELKA